MSRRTKLFRIVFAGVFAGLFLVTAAAFRKPDDVFFLLKKNFAIFSEVYTEVNALYVDPVDPQKMMRTGIDAMLETLDPYTVVIDEGQNTDMEIMTRGSYGGVGVEVDYRNGQIIVIAPVEGGSAAKKGIRSGDIIVGVDKIDVSELSPEEVERMMIGEVGTSVWVTIRRTGLEKPLEFQLTREKIEVNNVSYAGLIKADSQYAYVALERFGQDAAQEVKAALTPLVGPKTKGIILDLRNNPGGLLNEAVDLSGLFVDSGVEIARTKGRIQENNQVYRTRTRAAFPDQTVIVLQNRGSASASEVVAGSLQDLDRAVILGERSYGKGLVQIVRSLSYNLALKVTTAKYYIPSGRSIQSIDYTHSRRKAAKVVPDSLRKPYKTKNGRTVFDGAGIEPDVKWQEPEKSFIQTALLRESRYIFFSSEVLASKTPLKEVPAADDRLYEQFKAYLQRSAFKMELESESELGYLEDILKTEGLLADASKHLQGLRTVVETKKMNVLDKEKQLILNELHVELTGQLKGQRARQERALEFDPLIAEAVKLINDRNRVQTLLSGKK